MNFPLRTAFLHPIDFVWLCFHCHLSQSIFLISSLISSLTHWYFSSMLFSLHVIIFFSFLFQLLISSFMSLWSEKMLKIIFILLNLLRFVLYPSMWSILENVPCVLQKNVYSVFSCFFCSFWIQYPGNIN